MDFTRCIKKRIDNGRFRDLMGEILWVLRYIIRYRSFVAAHLLLGILSIGMTLGSSIGSNFLIVAVIRFDSGIIGTAASLMLGTRLLDALEEDPYSQRCHALSVEIFRWCKKMIPLVAGVNLTLNLAQVLLAPLLVTVHLELRLPTLSLAVAFGMMALTRLLEEGKAIKEDNDLYV